VLVLNRAGVQLRLIGHFLHPRNHAVHVLAVPATPALNDTEARCFMTIHLNKFVSRDLGDLHDREVHRLVGPGHDVRQQKQKQHTVNTEGGRNHLQWIELGAIFLFGDEEFHVPFLKNSVEFGADVVESVVGVDGQVFGDYAAHHGAETGGIVTVNKN
jgi:hypothetical protein